MVRQGLEQHFTRLMPENSAKKPDRVIPAQLLQNLVVKL